MRIKASLVLVFLLVLTVFPASSSPALGAPTTPDFPIPSGHFYTQTGGMADGSRGFSIVDNADAPLRSGFQALGGVDVLGFPSSRRFVLGGFISQATQKAILQWRPDLQQVVFTNVFDNLHDQGKDAFLLAVRQVPPPFDTSPDSGLTFGQVRARHLALLDISPAIRAAYEADADPLAHFGLPMSSADLGNVVVVRAQRAALQEWRIDTPWARAGQVTIANGGDIAKEAGLVPTDAANPEPTPAITQMTAQQVAEAAIPSVVEVELPGVLGSGIVFDPRGYIVTNNHVVESGGPVTVSSEKGSFRATVVGKDPLSDLAVLKVDNANLPPLPLGNSDALVPGEAVVAIGFSPLLPNPPNFYEAKVLRLVNTTLATAGFRADFVQTDAPLHPGDSGGPLLNLFGEVVGIDTALIIPRQSTQRVLASSIAIDRAEPILQELIAKGKIARPAIGATVHVIVPGLNDNLPADHGLLVLSVIPGLPAASAGIEAGDVITAADGIPLNLASDLQQILSDRKVGDKMTLTFVDSSGQTRTAQVTLVESQ